MDQQEWEFYAEGVRESRGNFWAIILLAALLVCVFFLAIGAYGYFAAIGDGSLTGELPNAVLALRDFVEKNDTIAVILGFSSSEALETIGPVNEREAYIRGEADAYIREKQGG